MRSTLIAQWLKEEKVSFEGWDFSHLRNRKIPIVDDLPWNYGKIAKEFVRRSVSALDMGTGGGEVFSKFAPFPKHAVATEGYVPNFILAKKRLKPLAVNVIKYSNSTKRKMPFKNGEFDLILNRHDAFNSKEIFRILQPNGIFLTQQTGGNNMIDLIKIFNRVPKYKSWSLKVAKDSLTNTGFTIIKVEHWKGKSEFRDVGAVVYYLKNIPWYIHDFSVEKYLPYLEKLQRKLDKGGRLLFTEVRFLIIAKKL